MTVPEAARRTGRNPETIRRWIREGRLASRRVGTQYFVDELDLDEAAHAGDEIAVPPAWRATSTGESMPDWVSLVRRSRARR